MGEAAVRPLPNILDFNRREAECACPAPKMASNQRAPDEIRSGNGREAKCGPNRKAGDAANPKPDSGDPEARRGDDDDASSRRDQKEAST